ncbi:MAG: argininosuccinate lyase [Bacilli bacterium]|nr:argininosuccinate lyase [Bacilli bacterium]
MAMWEGRFKKELDTRTNDFNSSISIDKRLYKYDILGSIAHATMLGKQGIIDISESEKIIDGLNNILSDLESGKLSFDLNSEDIHMFIEDELTKRIGETGKRLHTARSRNDQVTTDLRLYLKDECNSLMEYLRNLIGCFIEKAEDNLETIMPGYTHLQRAQPTTFAHHLMAYVDMFLRDLERLNECFDRMNVNPLGSCALAGTTHNIDRFLTSKLLDFNRPCFNSLDGVSDRDYVLELSSVLAIVMIHLSRFSEEVVLWSSWEFKFIELDDAFSTGSSIMPQKKNPDITELIRGKSGRVIGNLTSLLSIMKGLPLAYNKDMQEDKELIFDSIDTIKKCISILIPMVDTMVILKENMLKAAKSGFINATDVADYLVKKGIPFRKAYKITGSIVANCIDKGITLDELSISEYKSYSSLFDEDIYKAIDLYECAFNRKSYGGPNSELVKNHIGYVKKLINLD